MRTESFLWAGIHSIVWVTNQHTDTQDFSVQHLSTLTLDIKDNLDGVNQFDAPPADVIPGLTVVASAVAGLDDSDGVSLSWTDELSFFVQTVSALAHRWVGITAAAESHWASFDDVSWWTHWQSYITGGIWWRED